MQTYSIYQKLRQFFPNDLENITLAQTSTSLIDQPQALSYMISSSLPHMTLEQMHTLCRKQEKNVMDKILEIKKIDLYEEIANVCPSQKGLRNMPVEEVTLKINQMNAKMALQQRVLEEESEEMQSCESSEQENISEQMVSMHPMEIQEMQYHHHVTEPKGLHNIFQQYDNAHLPWNQMCIYDLN